jgi:PKD repeat protein
MKTMKKIILLLTCLSLISFNSFSQEFVEIYKKKKFNKEFQKSVDGFRKKNKKLKFKFNEQYANVEAEEIFLSTPEVFTQGKGGRKKVRNLKAPKHYRLKSGNSFGVLTVTESGIIGAIGSLNITDDSLVLQSNEGQVLETDAPVEYNSPVGQAQSVLPTTAENIISQSNSILPQSVRKVYVVDFDLYKALGSSVQNCLNWAQSVHAGVLPYYQELGITNTLFKVIVNTDTSAYFRICTGVNNALICNSGQVLLQFASDYRNESGDLLHLLTLKNYGGLAYLSGIGPTSNIKFCLSGVFTNVNLNNNYSWTINVVAHEEGHLYGSRHTQWCGWYKPNGSIGRLDSCWQGESTAYTSGCSFLTKSSGGQGTIMSYCHQNGGINLSKGFFFPQIKEVMRRTLMNSTVAGGPTNNCTWTYGPWSSCIPNNLGEVYPDGNGYQTRTATPNTDVCKGYPLEATARACWVSTGTPTQPIADFAATYSTGVEGTFEYKTYQNLTGPTAVTFKDKSTGIPNTWAWDFGDNKTSTQKNPTNLYANAGIYRVTLNASNAVGTSSATKNDYVWIVGNNGIPVPDFQASRLSGAAPVSVQFVNLSSTNSFQFIWNFKNSSGTVIGTSQERNPRFTFSSAGVYTVSLLAINKNGQNTIEKVNLINVSGTVLPPVVNFTGTPLTGTAPLTVNFTDLTTNNPTSWFWNFGNGVTSTVKNPSVTYTQPGTYTVTLSAANAGGNNAFIRTAYITVNPSTVLAPVANFSATPLTGTAPLTVNFTDLTTNNPTSWSWNFGNGQTSTLKNPTTTYTTIGSYTVSLTATNSAGSNTFTRTSYITVSTTPPPSTPTVTVYKKGDNRWYINFNSNSTQSISTNVCRYTLAPCNPASNPSCGGRTSPSIIVGNNEFLMNPQPTPPSSGIWCYRVSITQGTQVYWSNFFEFIK